MEGSQGTLTNGNCSPDPTPVLSTHSVAQVIPAKMVGPTAATPDCGIDYNPG